MGTIRLVRRLALFGGFTVLSYFFLLLSSPFVRLVRGNGIRWRARIMNLWARGSMPLIGMRLQVEGAPPAPPFFLVTNHLSYVDILAVASQTRCTMIAKSEIASWPIFGALCRCSGTIFIERASKRDIPRVIAQIEETLAHGVGVVLFPEATSSNGSTVLPFRPPLLEAAARKQIPVSYCALSYSVPGNDPPAREVVCWWTDVPFVDHFQELFRIPGFDAKIVFGLETIRDEDRKALAARLHRAILERFQPVA